MIAMVLSLVLSTVLNHTLFLSSSPAINTYAIVSLPSRIETGISNAYRVAVSWVSVPLFVSKPSQNPAYTYPDSPGRPQSPSSPVFPSPSSFYSPPTATPNPAYPTPTSNPLTPTSTPNPHAPTATPTVPHGTSGQPFVLGNGNKAPSVAFDSGGVAHFSWWDPGTHAVWYTSCSGNNSCVSPERVSPVGVTAYYSSVSIGQSGPVVAWEAADSATTYAVYVSRKSGGWGNGQKVSTESYAEVPHIASDGGSQVYLVYQSKSGGAGSVYYRSSNDGGVSWSAAEKIGDGFMPRLAVGGDGSVYAVWFDSPSYTVYHRKKTGSGWSPPITVVSGTKDQTPDVAVDGSGNVHVVWSENSGNYRISYKKYGPLGNELENKNDISAGLTYGMWPKIAVVGNDPLVVFQGKTGSAWGIYKAVKKGSWEAPQAISQTNSDQQNPDITISGSKSALIYTDSSRVWGLIASP